MDNQTETTPSDDGGDAWPYSRWKLYVGRVLELGDGVRMILIKVRDTESASVQVFHHGKPAEADIVRLHLDRPVDCKGRSVRLLQAVPGEGDRPWIRVSAS